MKYLLGFVLAGCAAILVLSAQTDVLLGKLPPLFLFGPGHQFSPTNEVTIVITAPRQFTKEELVQWLKQSVDMYSK